MTKTHLFARLRNSRRIWLRIRLWNGQAAQSPLHPYLRHLSDDPEVHRDWARA